MLLNIVTIPDFPDVRTPADFPESPLLFLLLMFALCLPFVLCV